MPSVKRKAPPGGATQGGAKAGRASKTSTPGAATPRSIESSANLAIPAAKLPSSPAVGSNDGYNENGEYDEDDEEDPTVESLVDKFSIESYASRPPPGGAGAGAGGRSGEGLQHIFKNRDFSYLRLKPDAHKRPLWISPEKGHIILESFSPLAMQATDFLITIAEPQSRPMYLHEYALTPHSLYAAVSVGIAPREIISVLDKFSKTPLPENIKQYIEQCTRSYGKVKMVLKNTKYFVESSEPEILQKLLKDPVIGPLRVNVSSQEIVTSAAPKKMGLVIPGTRDAAGVKEAGGSLQRGVGADPAPVQTGDVLAALAGDSVGGAGGHDDDDDDDEREVTHSFEIPDSAVETVQKRCLELEYPMLEEYDFRGDEVNPNLEIDLKPGTMVRPYQEKSLTKMFSNSRAKSGIIVLPCGAGKTLVGITAACTIHKGVIVLCTSGMSVIQWRNEFLKWSNVKPEDIVAFTSDQKSAVFPGSTGIIVATYSMVAQTTTRSHDSQKMIDFISSREWGLMLLDEVHVVPANMFRNVTSRIKSHAKLGLTATLLREDDKITDLNFLIGPKLYEANWMELSAQGHIARVQCAEVWCPMPTEFYDEYLRAPPRKRDLLYIMNPSKFQACQYLINYHESRGDKIIVFSDNVYALKAYAEKLQKFYIYGGTGQVERMRVLGLFQNHPEVKTLFLSKIGDTSLDLPEATCLIQISSQYGSRRQEAQRLGRILRAKRRNDEGFNAFFYSLVSKDTQEMYFSSKRQAFLVDQGYSFKVITQLANIEKTAGLAFATASERRELLAKILVENETVQYETEEVDDMHHRGEGGRGGRGGPGRRRRRKPIRRAANTLSDLSGGQNMAYVEQNRRANQSLKRKNQDRSAFFKKIQREKDKK